MLAGNAIQAMYQVINAFWVGKRLGEAAMTAVTVSFPVLFMMMAVAIGLTMATSILVSQAYGAKDWTRLKRIVQSSLLLVAVVSVLCVVASHFLAETILRRMDTPANVLPLAVNYLHIIILFMPFMFGTFLLASMLRGVGDSKTPLYFMGSGLLLTAVLDPLLMFGWLGFPRMGLNGTAVATIISNFLALFSLLIYLHKKRHIVSPDLHNFSFDRSISWQTIKIGVPSMFQNAMFSIGIAVVTRIINGFGETGAAAFGIASRIDQIAFLPAMTIGMAVATLSGQNIGAGHYHRVKEVLKWGLLISCGITLPTVLVLISFPGPLMSVFSKSQVVINIGIHYFHIMAIGYFLLAVLFACNGVINGSGRTLVTTFITLAGLWLVRLPVAEYLSKSMHSLDGVWYAMVLGFGVGAALSLAYYLSGKWKSPVIKGTAEPEYAALSEEAIIEMP